MFSQDHKSFDEERATLETSTDLRVTNGAGNNHTRNNNNLSEVDAEFDRYPKYPIDILRSEASLLPDSIDPKRKEIHLTHDDFVGIFDMKFTEFESLPNWRKQELKKRHKLF